MKKNEGQALVEFAIGLLLVTGVVAGAGVLLRAQWERFRCAREGFETAHARMIGAQTLGGVRRCDERYRERLVLPALEATPW